VLPLIETSRYAGFSCFYPNLELSPLGVNQPNIGVYWGRFGVNYWGKDSNFAPMAMVKASAGTPQIKNSNGRLQIVLSQGGKRSYLSLGVPDSKQNRVYAQMIATQIWNDILAGHFTGIEKYKRVTETKPEQPPAENITLTDLWERYTDYKRSQLSQTTIAKDFDRVRCNIAKLPSQKLTDAVAIRDYLIKHTTPNTAKRVLSKISAACTWGVMSNFVASNPFIGMSADIKTGKKSDDSDINPFTPEEKELIIDRFKSDGSHYAPLVEFLFKTGCRPSEAIALQIKHLEKEYRSITFCQSVTASESGLKLKQGLKTQSQRVFPCGEGLCEFLRSLVFDTLKEGLRPNPERFLFEPIKPSSKFTNIDKFSYREWHKVLKSLGIVDRGIYQCRHTYITFCLDSGMDAKDVAKLVGNSPEMIYRHYAGAKKDLIAPDF
jgi:integrase